MIFRHGFRQDGAKIPATHFDSFHSGIAIFHQGLYGTKTGFTERDTLLRIGFSAKGKLLERRR